MQPLRISYTSLNYWHRHDYDNLLAYYAGIKTATTPQMEQGTMWDLKVQESITKENCLPPEFNSYPCRKPQIQVKLTATIQDEFILVGVPDVIDEPEIIEIKTGVMSSGQYASSMQIKLYSLLAKLNNLDVNRFKVMRYNQYIKQMDWTLIHNHEGLAEDAYMYIGKEAPQMKAFLIDQGLL